MCCVGQFDDGCDERARAMCAAALLGDIVIVVSTIESLAS
jgi:hypothetical protein